MKCVMCDNPAALKAQLKTINYKECGLENVTLLNVPVYHCAKCGEEYHEISNPEQLHSALAKAILMKQGFLTGAEVRFLRKFLGFSGVQFAKVLGYDHTTLSRIEKESPRNPVTQSFDRIVRFAVNNRLKCDDYDLLDLYLNETLIRMTRYEAKRSKKGEWIFQKAA